MLTTLVAENGRWLIGLAGVVGLTIVVEQLLSLGLRSWMLRHDPLVSSIDDTAFYQRSLFTAASREVRLIWAGLLASGALSAVGLLLHPVFFVVAAAAMLATLAWELKTWECVAVSPWQVAWRRGWGRSIRRLPMVQIARIHMVERELSRRHGWLARRWGRPLGSCYLALELHNGRAVKLPRTGLVTGRAAVVQVAQFLRKRKRLAERERIAALNEQRRVSRRARRLMPEAGDLVFRQELARLRRSQAQAVHRIGRWPGQVLDMPADTGPDTIQISAPGDLIDVTCGAERAPG